MVTKLSIIHTCLIQKQCCTLLHDNMLAKLCVYMDCRKSIFFFSIVNMVAVVFAKKQWKVLCRSLARSQFVRVESYYFFDEIVAGYKYFLFLAFVNMCVSCRMVLTLFYLLHANKIIHSFYEISFIGHKIMQKMEAGWHQMAEKLGTFIDSRVAYKVRCRNILARLDFQATYVAKERQKRRIKIKTASKNFISTFRKSSSVANWLL